jgi:D-3-phosphoglycerate dehydrogenase
MTKRKILVCAPIDEAALTQLAGVGDLTFAGWAGPDGMHAPPLTAEQMVEMGNDADVIIIGTEPMLGEVLQKLPALKLLVCSRAGVESVDIKQATSRRIPVLNSPGRNAFAVADFTIGLLISLVREIPRSQSFLSSGQWKSVFSPADYGLEGMELPERTLGIIGMGMIGRLVAKRAAGFDMKVLGYDPYVSEGLVKESGVEPTTLKELLQTSDFISLHCALTPETKHLLNSKMLSLIRSSTYIINTARAALIEEEPFIQALQNQKIAGAALDVFWKEPIPQDHPLLKLDNVLITPHIAGMGDQVFHRGSRMIVDGIISFFSGIRPNNLVNPDVFTMSDGIIKKEVDDQNITK